MTRKTQWCQSFLHNSVNCTITEGPRILSTMLSECLILFGSKPQAHSFSTVRKYSKKSLVVVDMPYQTYKNKFDAYKNAMTILKLTKCDAVKLEGGKKVSKIIKFLVSKGVSVMGHIGLLPQSSKNFKFKGKTTTEKKRIFEDALSISQSGVFAIVLECVIEPLARKITQSVPVPVIGIGASKYCDGQILVTEDMLGLSDFSPKFVKKYSNLKNIIEKNIKNYVRDVKLRKFPSNKNVYK